MWPPSLLSLLQKSAALLVVGAAVVEGRGGSRRRARSRGRKKKRSAQQSEEESAPWSWHRTSKSEEATKSCGELAPLPPERLRGDAVEVQAAPGDQWRYLRLPTDGQYPHGEQRLEQVDWTPARETACRELFVGMKPPASIATGQSHLVCMLASLQDDASEQALFASDYNTERGLPNFVAFVLPGGSNTTVVQPRGNQETAHAAKSLDVAYATGKPQPCCWCAGEGVDAEGPRNKTSYECAEAVGARGHLVPLSALSPLHMMAADVFLNTVPMRKPFIDLQWSRRVQELYNNGHHVGGKGENRRLHVMMGPSLQTDGYLPAAGHTSPDHRVEVPSFLWAAYADHFAIAASGYFCRNGGPDNGCACVDGLRLMEIEARLGFRLFPGMPAAPQALPSFKRTTSTSFAWVVGSIIVVLVVLMCFVLVFGSSEPVTLSRSERERQANLRAKSESAAGEKKMRAELESRVGGKEALRARFRNV